MVEVDVTSLGFEVDCTILEGIVFMAEPTTWCDFEILSGGTVSISTGFGVDEPVPVTVVEGAPILSFIPLELLVANICFTFCTGVLLTLAWGFDTIALSAGVELLLEPAGDDTTF